MAFTGIELGTIHFNCKPAFVISTNFRLMAILLVLTVM